MSTNSEKASFQLPLIRERQRANSILPIRCNLAKMAQESDFLAERVIDGKTWVLSHRCVLLFCFSRFCKERSRLGYPFTDCSK